MSKISFEFERIMEAMLPKPPDYENFDFSHACSHEQIQDFADSAKIFIEYLNDFDVHAAPGCSYIQSEYKYPLLMILGQVGMAPRIKEILLNSKAAFPSFINISTDADMGTSSMLLLVKDIKTQQEGVLFRAPPSEVKGFAEDLLSKRAAMTRAHAARHDMALTQ